MAANRLLTDDPPVAVAGGGDDDRQANSAVVRASCCTRFVFLSFFGLAGDMMFFAILVVLFFARQAGTHMDPRTTRDWRLASDPAPADPLSNTAILLLSSLTMEFGRRNIFREIDVLEEWLGLGRPALQRTLPWMAATLVLGVHSSSPGNGSRGRQLTAQGFAFDHWSTPASYFFYIITGLHAAHLILGVLALAVCLCRFRWLKRVELRQIAVDATAWYWHAHGTGVDRCCWRF